MILSVRVIPNSKKPEIFQIEEGKLKIKVDAPPIENRANERLIEILAEHFHTKKSHIKIIRGLNSRNKIIEITQF